MLYCISLNQVMDGAHGARGCGGELALSVVPMRTQHPSGTSPGMLLLYADRGSTECGNAADS